ncbi:MAG TPA: MerR family transcriptional regulator [Usitatibacter sp.]|jgi:MerR family redox-sensitive transcriptional activator SoxR|nr:MerR family transcriptional regulator [Usitatibacter sp.]
MSPQPISTVARQFGLRASALRYYERIGILSRASISGGKRHYDAAGLNRIAIIQLARSAGFSLADIRELFTGYAQSVPASRRWREITERKQAQLEDTARRIRGMQLLLSKMGRCGCDGLDLCGARIRKAACAPGRTLVR